MANRNGLFIVHRGSSYAKAWQALNGLADQFASILNHYDVKLALTSTRAVQKLQARGFDAKTVENQIFDSKYDTITILPLMLFEGNEYESLANDHLKYYQSDQLHLLPPLMTCEEEIIAFSKSLATTLPDGPVLLVGHGSATEANNNYEYIEMALRNLTENQAIFVTTLLETPKSVLSRLQSANVQNLTLMPLMLTAGYHVTKDIFGENSIESVLSDAQIKVDVINEGLIENALIQSYIMTKLNKSLEEANGI